MSGVLVTDATELADAVGQINAVHERVVRAGIEGVVEVGRIVLDVAYGGDETLYHSRNPNKGVGVRQIAEHPDLRLPGNPDHRAQALARAVRLYITYRTLPDAARPLVLEHHLESLAAVKSPAIRTQLAEMAAKDRPSKKKFRRAVVEAREEAGEKRRRTVGPGIQSHPTPAAPSPLAPTPVLDAPDWKAIATQCLDQPAGRSALDALLAARGLQITPILPSKAPRSLASAARSKKGVDVSSWAIHATGDRTVQLRVRTADLTSALKVLPFGSDPRSINAHVLFQVRTGQLELLSCKGRVLASVPVLADGDALPTDAWTIEARRLKDVVKGLKEETVLLGFDRDRQKPFVQSSTSALELWSLDVASFPHWDEALRNTRMTAKLSAARLGSALAYSKQFTSDDEVEHSDLIVCEVQRGGLWSSDKQALSLVRVAGLENAGFRIHRSDVAGFTTFLKSAGTSEVELMEHERMLFIRRVDGAVFGGMKPSVSFLTKVRIGIDAVDEREWVVPKVAITRAMEAFAPSKGRQRDRLNFDFKVGRGTLIVSMMSVAEAPITHEVPCVETILSDDAKPLPSAGFMIDRESLRKVLSAWQSDHVKIGVKMLGERGGIRFVFERDGDKYLTMVIGWVPRPPSHD